MVGFIFDTFLASTVDWRISLPDLGLIQVPFQNLDIEPELGLATVKSNNEPNGKWHIYNLAGHTYTLGTLTLQSVQKWAQVRYFHDSYFQDANICIFLADIDCQNKHKGQVLRGWLPKIKRKTPET